MKSIEEIGRKGKYNWDEEYKKIGWIGKHDWDERAKKKFDK